MSEYGVLAAALGTNFMQVDPQMIVVLAIVITAFLCLLNIGLAVFYRKRRRAEVVSYYVAFGIELAIFLFAVLYHFGAIATVPHLPPGLPINSPEIGAFLAFGIGLIPAAYWHRVNISELPKRIAEDAKGLNERDAGVRIRSNAPGEWMN